LLSLPLLRTLLLLALQRQRERQDRCRQRQWLRMRRGGLGTGGAGTGRDDRLQRELQWLSSEMHPRPGQSLAGGALSASRLPLYSRLSLDGRARTG